MSQGLSMNKMLFLLAAWMGIFFLLALEPTSIDLGVAGVTFLISGMAGVVSFSFVRTVDVDFRTEWTDILAIASLLVGVFGLCLATINALALYGAFLALVMVIMSTVVAVRSLKFGTNHMRYVPVLTVMVTGIASHTAAYSGWEWVQAASFSIVGWPLAFLFANFSDKRAIAPADIGSAQAG